MSSPQVQRNHACSNNHSCTLSVYVITKCTRFEANHMELSSCILCHLLVALHHHMCNAMLEALTVKSCLAVFYVIFLWLCITTCAMQCLKQVNHKELSSCILCHLAVALFITVTYSSFCSNGNSLGTWHL